MLGRRVARRCGNYRPVLPLCSQVLVQPSIPPAEVQAFPASLRPLVSLGLHLEGPAWAALKQRVLFAASGRCAVSGAPLAAVHERWAFDDDARVLRLAGLRAEAPEVQQVGRAALAGCAGHEIIAWLCTAHSSARAQRCPGAFPRGSGCGPALVS